MKRYLKIYDLSEAIELLNKQANHIKKLEYYIEKLEYGIMSIDTGCSKSLDYFENTNDKALTLLWNDDNE